MESAQPSRLLQLPAEIRLMIYDFYEPSEVMELTASYPSLCCKAAISVLALCQVSTQIRAEVLPHFYARAIVESKDIVKLRGILDSRAFQAIAVARLYKVLLSWDEQTGVTVNLSRGWGNRINALTEELGHIKHLQIVWELDVPDEENDDDHNEDNEGENTLKCVTSFKSLLDLSKLESVTLSNFLVNWHMDYRAASVKELVPKVQEEIEEAISTHKSVKFCQVWCRKRPDHRSYYWN